MAHTPKTTRHTERAVRRVPNPQVLDAAGQFHEAYRLLAREVPGILLAEVHCASIALELYLKALSAVDVDVADNIGDLGISVRHASPRARHHRLHDLYDLVEPLDRQVIDLAFAAHPRLASAYPSARVALETHSRLLAASRYPFEPDSGMKAVDLPALSDLLEMMEGAVRTVRGKRQSR